MILDDPGGGPMSSHASLEEGKRVREDVIKEQRSERASKI